MSKILWEEYCGLTQARYGVYTQNREDLFPVTAALIAGACLGPEPMGRCRWTWLIPPVAQRSKAAQPW